MRTIHQIDAELAVAEVDRARAVAEINRMAQIQGELTPGQAQRWADTNQACDRSFARIEELQAERSEAIAARSEQVAAMNRGVAVTGDGAAGYGQHVNVNRGRSDVADTMSRAGALGGAETAAGTAVLVDGARAAIEDWPSIRSGVPAEYQEAAESVIVGADPRYRAEIAAHVLALSTPEYSEAFNEYMASGPQFMSSDARRVMLAAERAANPERAMSEGSTAAGQAIVPPFLDPSIILTNAGTINPFRALADVRSIATQTWRGVTTAGVVAEWTAEAAEATDASPSDWGQPSITPVRADAYVEISYELAMDTTIVTDIAMLFADARDRLEGTAFAVGTGSTQPFGCVTDLQLVTASRVATVTNGAFGAVDVFALDSALPARHRRNASWIAHPAIWNVTRQFASGTAPQNAAFWADFGGDLPSKLLGRPVYESSDMQSSLSTATASNDDLVIVGDFRYGMKIIDRIGMSIGRIDVVGANRRPKGSTGFFAFWRVGSKVLVPDALRMLRA